MLHTYLIGIGRSCIVGGSLYVETRNGESAYLEEQAVQEVRIPVRTFWTLRFDQKAESNNVESELWGSIEYWRDNLADNQLRG